MTNNKIYPGGGAVECSKTPLPDLLRGVPKDYRLVVNHDKHSSSYHPVGAMCHEAADEIERLRAEVKDWRHQFKNMEAIADMRQEQINTIALLDKASALLSKEK